MCCTVSDGTVKITAERKCQNRRDTGLRKVSTLHSLSSDDVRRDHRVPLLAAATLVMKSGLLNIEIRVPRSVSRASVAVAVLAVLVFLAWRIPLALRLHG